MFIVSMGCGLGNQMFEYAFLSMLKRTYSDVDIKIDSKCMLPVEHNGYELDYVFGIYEKEAELEEIKLLSDYISPNRWNSKPLRFVRGLKRKLNLWKNTHIFQGDFTQFNKKFFELDSHKSYYLHGVWANEQYFSQIKEYLIDEVFVFKKPLNQKGEETKNKILERSNSVSIHIRGGDYLDTQNLSLQLDYYEKAMAIMKEAVDSLTWFVFSDDIEYAKKVLENRKDMIFVEGCSGQDSWMDMYLMSICTHNIIANSTFSFWGAYLNKNKDKIVISSKQPFVGCSNPFVAEGWIAI